MEKRIELEKRGLAPDMIKELILDNCRSTSIQGLTDEFVNLVSLSLINVGLTSLKGFPKLPKLKRLEMSDNRISSGLNALQTSPLLQSLNISNNRIKDLAELEPLSKLKSLRVLDLFNNEVTSEANYRDAVFNMLPNLVLLDGFDRNNMEADDDEDDEDMNGNEDDSEEDDEEDDDGESEEAYDEEEDGVGLAAVYKDNLEEESEGEEYEGEEEEDESLDEEEDDDAEEEAESTPRGKKRKLEDGGKEDGSSKKSNGPSD